jgi:hypothetical protein
MLTCLASALVCDAAFAERGIAGDCPPDGYSRQQLDAAKANDFQPGDDISDDAFAVVLADCLGSPDPVLRDGIAYEGLTALLRGGRVSDAGKRTLLTKLSAALRSAGEDTQGFAKPFAALGLAEVARTDRVGPYLTTEERRGLVQSGVDYLVSIDDYRGFNEQEGWRHGIAHTADLLMQLALNDNVGATEHHVMLAAISSQISPSGIFYHYGEPGRLARPVLYIAAKGTLSEDEWSTWFTTIASPEPLPSWADTYTSDLGLAKRHNTSNFLRELYLNASLSQNDGIKALLPGTIEAIKAVQ